MGNQAVHEETAQSEVMLKLIPGKELPTEARNYVLASWLRSLRHGNDYFKIIDSDSYYKAYENYIKRLLMTDSCLVRFAALSDQLDVLLGFSVSRGTTLDYVFVKKDFRGIGIGKRLTPKDITHVTHLTKTGMAIWVEMDRPWKFNPFI